MKLKNILLPMSLLMCSTVSINSAAASYDHLLSTPSLDGDVSSSWAVDVLSDEMTIGSTGALFPNNHKAIVTFDTTQLDASKTIRSASARIFFSELPAGMTVPDVYDYLEGNLKIEVSGAFGFGGSYIITAMDYYAVPAGSLSTDAVGFGWFGDVGIDLTGHINPFGQTQISVSLINNPDNIAIKFNSGEVSENFPEQYHQEPILNIAYE